VIAGRFRGQRLAAPPGDRTRPTSDRVREAVFSSFVSWLGTGDRPGEEALADVSLLDLYGGSGGIAIEAASRGARPVRLVERDAKVAAVARRNAEHVGADVQVTTAPVAAFLSGPSELPYDIVWLDPPYAVGEEEVSAVARAVLEGGWLADDGLLVVERSSRTADPVLPPWLDDVWSRRYGETTIHYATRKAGQ
jgi:16S rRNA (guanine966-N2)-methyltransferase